MAPFTLPSLLVELLSFASPQNGHQPDNPELKLDGRLGHPVIKVGELQLNVTEPPEQTIVSLGEIFPFIIETEIVSLDKQPEESV